MSITESNNNSSYPSSHPRSRPHSGPGQQRAKKRRPISGQETSTQSVTTQCGSSHCAVHILGLKMDAVFWTCPQKNNQKKKRNDHETIKLIIPVRHDGMANAPIHPTPTRPDQPIPSRPIQLVQLDLSLPDQTHLNPQDPYLYLCCPHPPFPKNHACQILPLPSRPPHPPRTVPSSPVQSPATPATVSLYAPPRPMPAAPIPSHSVHPTTRMRECMKNIFFVKDATTPRSSNSHEYCMQLT